MQHFTVSEGQASGLSLKQLRGAAFDRSVWGVRSAAGTKALQDRCRMFALRLPDVAVFSHTTAALLWRAPLSLEWEESSVVQVAVPAPGRAPHARGIRGHELQLSDGDVRVVMGLRCTSPARTWCDLAGILSLPDLVAVGDYLIQWRSPLTTIAELTATARRFHGRRGMTRIREALVRLNERSESRPESHLRVIVADAGLPEPTVNHVIVYTTTGQHVRTDLAFPDFKLILEYQGDYHRTREQWRKDMTRRTRLEVAGWYVMELNWDDLKDPSELVARIRGALSRRR